MINFFIYLWFVIVSIIPDGYLGVFSSNSIDDSNPDNTDKAYAQTDDYKPFPFGRCHILAYIN